MSKLLLLTGIYNPTAAQLLAASEQYPSTHQKMIFQADLSQALRAAAKQLLSDPIALCAIYNVAEIFAIDPISIAPDTDTHASR